MHLTWLDNNSWLIEMAEQRILLDPWLVDSLVFGNMPWLFRGHHLTPRPIPETIDLILLSQGLEDHAHPPTLQQLDRNIPVVASPNAAKVARSLGYTQVTALPHGDCFTVANQVKIQAVPGDPIGPFLTENGYILTELEQDIKLYYDPHGYHSPDIQAFAPIDVVITPLVSLQIPGLGAIIKGGKDALQAVEWLHPQVILPTAAGGNIQFEGLLMSVLQTQGSINDFQTLLSQNNSPARVVAPKPGERFELELVSVGG